MGSVYFVTTDYYAQGGYVPYQDFFKLAELSGYPVIHIAQIDPQSDNTYILSPFNGEWQDGWQKPKARIIAYQLEWSITGKPTIPPGVAEVWCGDKWAAREGKMRYVPLGSHPGLNRQPIPDMISYDKMYDVAFMGYRAPYRRAHMLAEWQNHNLSIAPDAWGLQRSQYLNVSRCMGIVHQHDNNSVIAPLRMCIAAAHHCPVISEGVEDAGMFELFITQAGYNYLTKIIAQRLSRPEQLFDDGEVLHQFLCYEYTFREAIDGAL